MFYGISIWKCKGPRISKTDFGMEYKIGGFTLLDIKTYAAIEIQPVNYSKETKMGQLNNAGSRKVPQMCENLMYYKNVLQSSEGNYIFNKR
jgi:hypothetical protein